MGPTLSERIDARRRHEVPDQRVRCSEFDARDLLNYRLGRATAIAARLGLRVRAIVVNGKEPPHILDFEPTRIDVIVSDGIVVAVREVG